MNMDFDKIFGRHMDSFEKQANGSTWCMGKKFKCDRGIVWRACVQLGPEIFMAVPAHLKEYPMEVSVVKMKGWVK